MNRPEICGILKDELKVFLELFCADIMAYEHESGGRISNDDREESEFVDIFMDTHKFKALYSKFEKPTQIAEVIEKLDELDRFVYLDQVCGPNKVIKLDNYRKKLTEIKQLLKLREG